MTATLMGMETEYAAAEFASDGRGTERDVVQAILNEIADANPHVPGREAIGLFLGNGARAYMDSGHVEYATPECHTPFELVAALRAGERVLAHAAAGASAKRGRTTLVFRSNVDHASRGTTWGSHESYHYRVDPQSLPGPLIPHLVTRIIYCGAGGLAPLPLGSGEFTLSPRAWFLEHAVSAQSTGSRGIFHLKDEAHAEQGHHRLHIIAGESLCSDVSALLRCGTTALIVAAIDAGAQVGVGLGLWAPIRALRAISLDTRLTTRVRLANARLMTALEIQRSYLADVERALRDGRLPAWAPEICRLWRETLDHLATDDGWAERALDWKIKQRILQRHAGGDADWSRYAAHCAAWRHVGRRLARDAEPADIAIALPSLDDLVGSQPDGSDAAARLTRYLEAKGSSWDDLRHFLKLQHRLMELDIRFGQLGDAGIYDQLARAGVLEAGLIADDAVRLALTHPPTGGRAMVRGEIIRQAHDAGGRRGFTADWTRVVDHQGARFADLSNPFESTVRWQELRQDVRPPTSPLAELRQRLSEVF
jgi:hypothetical protein